MKSVWKKRKNGLKPESEYEMENREERMYVCEHCLWGIEAHEGHTPTIKHYVDEEDDKESKCDWCEEKGFDVLYEMI